MITARVTVEFSQFRAALARVPGVELHLEPGQCFVPYEPLLVWTRGDDAFERFEAAVEEDPTVVSFTPLTTDHQRLYEADLNDEGSTPVYALLCRESAMILVAGTITTEGWKLCLRVPDKATIGRLHAQLRDQQVRVDVQSLHEDAAEPRRKLGLSDSQYEALLLAYERGYFAVPRETDMNELAAELGVSSQAVSERLRRALRTLLQRVTDEEVVGSDG
ncbi:helix-turn-helix domain-containing protein [Halegenticoccus soli]|uniref:helix-turn-helix domain-containing protein n=1 Tax=Halegenticoccus soli TaxID=1985678 RepID=UPI000C6CFCF7|nr:helix-turn-helix domain-containing protein [Halegenticoccus soli]